MNGFEQLEEAILSPEAPITPEETAFSDEDLSDDAALAIVLADTNTAEAYLQSKSLVSGLDVADDLYRGWIAPRVWPNGKPRSSLPSFLVLECVEKILPALHMTLWGNKRDPFELSPRGNTTPLAARAKGHVLSWAIKESGLKEQMRRGMKTILQYGFGVGNWGWRSVTKTKKKYVRDDDGNVTPKKETVEINRPFFHAMNLRRVLVDPAADTQDVRESAKYVILQMFITADELDDLRQDPSYKNVPTRDELREILSRNRNASTQDSLAANKSNTWRDLQAERDDVPTSADPLSQPLELLEYWTDDRVITTLSRCIVIRNEENEFDRKTQVSCAFVDVLGSAWGFGIAKLVAGDQRFAAGTRNMWVDSLALSLNPMFQQARGIGPGTQQIVAEPGRVVTTTGELKPLNVPSVTTEALNAVSNAEEHANRVAGTNGGANMPTQAMRTAQGINAFSGDIIQRLQYWLEIFCEVYFVPVLEAFLEMCCDRLTPAQVNEILVEAEGKAWQGDILDVYNADAKIEIDAAGKLTARVAAAQLVPQIIALLSNQAVQQSLAVQNKKFDYAQLLEEALPLMGWDPQTLIVDMTPEDQARAQQQNSAAIKGVMDQQLQAQKHQDDLENIEQKGYVQAGVAVLRQGMKNQMEGGNSELADNFGAEPQLPGQ